jgi:hypothetical protein
MKKLVLLLAFCLCHVFVFSQSCPKAFNVGANCWYSTHIRIILDGSEQGITYQVMNADTRALVGTAQTGTGDALDFLNIPYARTELRYTVRALNTTTGCITEMVPVTVPPQFKLTSTSRCLDEGLTLDGSEVGRYYILYRNGTRVDYDHNGLIGNSGDQVTKPQPNII